MTFSNSPRPNVYAHVPSPLPNIDFPTPFWINKLADFIIIGCTDPDLAYGALLVPAALKMLWTVATPATKQIIEGATGRSWICGSKRVISQTEQGSKLANSNTGKAVYGLVKGLDIAAYYAFMLSAGASGVVDYASFAAKFQRKCNGGQSAHVGITPIGGWGVGYPAWQTGQGYATSTGGFIGPFLNIPKGYIGAMIFWCSYTSLFGPGGVIVNVRIYDEDTGQVYDTDTVNNLFNTSEMAIVRYFTREGLADRDLNLAVQIQCYEAATTRMVPAHGGCFSRAWHPSAADAPPFWNMKDMLHQSGG